MCRDTRVCLASARVVGTSDVQQAAGFKCSIINMVCASAGSRSTGSTRLVRTTVETIISRLTGQEMHTHMHLNICARTYAFTHALASARTRTRACIRTHAHARTHTHERSREGNDTGIYDLIIS